MNKHSLSATDLPLPLPDASLSLPQIFGAIFLTIGTAGAIFGAGFLLFFGPF